MKRISAISRRFENRGDMADSDAPDNEKVIRSLFYRRSGGSYSLSVHDLKVFFH